MAHSANILLNTAQLGSTFFHHAHAYANHIVNSCTAKNVTDQDGNPTTPNQYSYDRKPSLANFRILDAQSSSNVMNQLSATS
jgi:hypothetical protein